MAKNFYLTKEQCKDFFKEKVSSKIKGNYPKAVFTDSELIVYDGETEVLKVEGTSTELIIVKSELEQLIKEGASK